MIKFGITGRSGVGKSTVARLFEKHGAEHIDSDKLVHKVQGPNTQCAAELAEYFGEGIIGEDGAVNRKVLGPIVFADPAKMKVLEDIVYKHLGILSREIEEKSTAKAIIVDAIKFIEGGRGWPVVAVIAPYELSLSRIMERDGITKEQAEARLAAQKGEEFFTSHADHVIINDGDMESVARQVDAVAKKLGL